MISFKPILIFFFFLNLQFFNHELHFVISNEEKVILPLALQYTYVIILTSSFYRIHNRDIVYYGFH